jgi:prevent-host-death family protein
MTVGVRDLKAHLSSYLRRVRSGATLSITDRGKVVATIQPAADRFDADWARRMVAEGKASWNGGKPTGLPTPVRLRGRGKVGSEMIIEDRR